MPLLSAREQRHQGDPQPDHHDGAEAPVIR